MADYSKMSDADLMTVVQPKADYSKMSDADLLKAIGPQGPQGFMQNAMDFAKSIPGGVVSGAKNALDFVSQEGTDYADKGYDPLKAPIERGVAAAKNALPKPQGRAGQVGEAIGEGLGNPLTYIGPGGAALKLGGSVLSSAGGELGRQVAEGTIYETPAQIAGSLAGGATAVKALGPTIEKAAVPTVAELKAAADKGYTAARASGFELHPQATSDFAGRVEQELTNGPKYAFTGGSNGTAPKTLAILDELQNPPAGAKITAGNLDTLRIRINDIAKETKDFKPTPDAKAAMLLKRAYNDFLENPPQNHILAGSPQDYVRNVTQANADYAAASRAGTFDARLTKAENATDRQIAGSLDAQIKSKAGSMLDNPKNLRGLTDAEKSQLQLINSGTPISNTLRQLGRGGAGVVPIMGHLITAAATGGASVPASIAIGAPLYAARKIAERMTVSRARELADMLAKRSPEYRSRLAGVSLPDRASNPATLARALLAH